MHFIRLLSLIPILCKLTVVAAEPERAVVKIINYFQQPDWIEPWRFSQVQGGTGSGFLIDENRIMTNAHVVSWSKQIHVQRHQDPKLYLAEIEFIGHDCDLAVLKINDPSFYKNMQPLRIGKLPQVRSSVTAYGYPAGGRQISYTRGVISRIEMQQYAHIYNRGFLTVQTDAAINPGNSGGPVIQDDDVVGVSFQGKPGLENSGFFIPPSVIQHFLEDIEDGNYDGFPTPGLSILPLRNPSFRKFLGLEDNKIGARIDNIYYPFPHTHELIQENDVLLEVEGYPVGNDGLIQYEGNRVSAGILFDIPQHGETIDLRIWRDGQALDIKLPLSTNKADRNQGNQYTPPPYYIVGGLVFTPLSRNYLSTLGKSKKEIDLQLIYPLQFNSFQSATEATRELLVLSSVLQHPINIDFGVRPGALLDSVNGHNINSIKDLAEAIESNTEDFHTFLFVQSKRIEALNREDTENATKEVLEIYKIPYASRIESPL